MQQAKMNRAVALIRYLPAEDLNAFADVTLDTRKPEGRDILVEVKAISVSRVDTKMRSLKKKIEKEPRVLGWDTSGMVVGIGPEATLFKPGDEVWHAGDITRPGTN